MKLMSLLIEVLLRASEWEVPGFPGASGWVANESIKLNSGRVEEVLDPYNSCAGARPPEASGRMLKALT